MTIQEDIEQIKDKFYKDLEMLADEWSCGNLEPFCRDNNYSFLNCGAWGLLFQHGHERIDYDTIPSNITDVLDIEIDSVTCFGHMMSSIYEIKK